MVHVMCLYYIIVNSFVDLVQFLLTLPDVSVFLSNRLCQDPLENFFGQQRQRGRVNENPNAQEFLKNTQALRVVNGLCPNISKGNCRGKNGNENSDYTNIELQKRKYKHK
jgi:hypothetical protein